MLRGQAGVQTAQALVALVHVEHEGAAQAHIQVIQALCLLAQALARVAQAAGQAIQAQVIMSQAVFMRSNRRRCRLSRRCCRPLLSGASNSAAADGVGAHIGDEVADRDVGFMTHGADDGRHARGHGAGDVLFVKAPQVLQRTSAPGQDQCIEAHAVGQAQGLDDLGNGLAALYCGGNQVQFHLGARRPNTLMMSRITAPVGR